MRLARGLAALLAAATLSQPTLAASLEFATLLGGREEFLDAVAGIAIGDDGSVYVVGGTDADDFPVVDALQPNHAGNGDAFIAKLTPEGEIVFSTYLGGLGPDSATAVEVAANGEIFVAGLTSSGDFPIVKGKQKQRAGATDAWVARIAKDGSRILASTYLGGDQRESRVGLELGRSGPLAKGVYVYGTTESLDFPQVKTVQSGYGGGLTDGFLAILKSNNLKPVLSTYAGGENDEIATGLALNNDRGDLYLGLFDDAEPESGAVAHFRLNPSVAFGPVANPKVKYDKQDRALGEILELPGTEMKLFALVSYFAPPLPLAPSVTGRGMGAIAASEGGVAMFTVPCVALPPATSCSTAGSLVLLDQDLSTLAQRGFGDLGSAFAPSAIASGPDGSIAVIGDTTAANLTLLDPIQSKNQGAFETYLYHFDDPLAGGPTLVTYYGGKQNDFSMAVAVGPNHGIWTGGVTFSKQKLTTTSDALRRKLAGRQDGYLIKIDPE